MSSIRRTGSFLSRRSRPLALLHALALGIVVAACSNAQELAPLPGDREDVPPVRLDVPYVPTPDEIVARMLDMADVGPDDHLIDLGSGDGRIVIAAVRDRGARTALGVEIDPRRIAEASANARAAGVEDRVRFERANLFDTDFSNATVLTMYLLQSINLQLRPVILDTLAPGTRVVSHVFDMGDWEPDRYEWTGNVGVYLWIVPARAEGRWQLSMPDGTALALSVRQRYQRIEGEAVVAGEQVALTETGLQGNEIRFSIGADRYIGTIDGDVMNVVSAPGAAVGWSARRI